MTTPKPNPNFQSSLPWRADRRAEALVIHCSAFDFRPYTQEFVEKGLGLTEYDLVAIPGGIQVLTLASFIPKHEGLVRKWIQFLTKQHQVPRVVIIGHEDCSWYRNFHFGAIKLDLHQRQIADLKKVAADLHAILGVTVEAHFAHIENGHVVFTAVE